MEDKEQLKAAKQALRGQYLARRRQLTAAEAAAASRQICQRLGDWLPQHLPLAAGRGVVFSYLAYGREVDLASLHRRLLGAGLAVAVPQTAGLPAGEMRAVYYDPAAALQKTSLGVWEPGPQAAVCPPERLAAVLLPGVAFDTGGGRLGHGGGYYDRFLAQLPPAVLLVGAAYEWQLAAEPLPREPWDRPLDWLVTEKRLLRC